MAVNVVVKLTPAQFDLMRKAVTFARDESQVYVKTGATAEDRSKARAHAIELNDLLTDLNKS